MWQFIGISCHIGMLVPEQISSALPSSCSSFHLQEMTLVNSGRPWLFSSVTCGPWWDDHEVSRSNSAGLYELVGAQVEATWELRLDLTPSDLRHLWIQPALGMWGASDTQTLHRSSCKALLLWILNVASTLAAAFPSVLASVIWRRTKAFWDCC